MSMGCKNVSICSGATWVVVGFPCFKWGAMFVVFGALLLALNALVRSISTAWDLQLQRLFPSREESEKGKLNGSLLVGFNNISPKMSCIQVLYLILSVYTSS